MKTTVKQPLGVLVVCLAAIVPRSSWADVAVSPHFLFIFVDDQAWNGTPVPMVRGMESSRTASYRMPNLENLAARGVTFSQAYAGHPKCECSRASLLMGRSTTSLNATDKNARLWNAPASESLPNLLKHANSNYRAAHFGKWQWHQTPASMGYDASDGLTQNSDGDSADPNDPKQSFGITRRAMAYMKKQVDSGHPFYIQLSYYAVHSRPQALASTLGKYEHNDARVGNPIMAAMTEDLDTCIGSLLKHLDDLGIASNTYVIYMSDNGGRTRVLKGGKGTVDEGGLRVPLIVSGPSVRRGVWCDEPVVGYDILPTVLDLASPGFVLPKGVEGGSWKDVLSRTGSGRVTRPINRLVFHHAVEVEHPQTALRQGDYKLIYFWDTKESFLYHLPTDLGETKNLSKQSPELTMRLLKELQTHVRAGLGEESTGNLARGVPNRPAQAIRQQTGGGNRPQKKTRREPNP